MTVVGLHPEELIDKLLEGEITPAERQRLRAHLDSCEVCRFEHQARLDFRNEAGLLAATSPPPLQPLRAPRKAVAVSRRRRSRLLVWTLTAAALVSASGVASVVSGTTPWQMSSLFSGAAAPKQQPAPKQRPAPKAAEKASASAAVEPTTLPMAADVAPTRPVHRRSRSTHAAAVAAQAVAAGAAQAARPSESKAPAAKEPTSAAKLFAEANQARRSGEFGRASDLYHLLQDQFPGSAEAELSRVTLSLLLLDSGDAQGALSGFERYLAGAPRGLEAEALVGRARALGRLGRRDLEATAWQEVQRKYPRSIYGRQASERLLALGQP